MNYFKKPLNDNDVENQWLKIQNVFLHEYTYLTSADLVYQNGDFGKMLKRIGQKIGLTESQLRRRILRWEDAASHYF